MADGGCLRALILPMEVELEVPGKALRYADGYGQDANGGGPWWTAGVFGSTHNVKVW
jgi:hypothetical protein